jgi:hypothetical protein
MEQHITVYGRKSYWKGQLLTFAVAMAGIFLCCFVYEAVKLAGYLVGHFFPR